RARDAPALARRARRRRGPRHRARTRRVRSDDHVRRLIAGRDTDPVARDLRAVRHRLGRRARDQCIPHSDQRTRSPVRQADEPMALRIRFVHALRSFSASADLTVEPGETVALVGPSGAGKTTVLRVVAGLLRPDDGFVALDEAVLLDTARRVDVAPERRRIGYLFQ